MENEFAATSPRTAEQTEALRRHTSSMGMHCALGMPGQRLKGMKRDVIANG